LLRELGLDPIVIPPNIDESIPQGAEPHRAAAELSRFKVEAVAADEPNSVIIAADTIVILGDRVLGKPSSKDEAASMLRDLVGNWHEVITGLTAMDTEADVAASSYERTKVHMRHLDEEAIAWYVSTGEPMDKAGAYGIQGIGSGIVDRIEGCFYNVVGLPVPRLCVLLEEALGFGTEPDAKPASKGR
jgi:septum formation protein